MKNRTVGSLSLSDDFDSLLTSYVNTEADQDIGGFKRFTDGLGVGESNF